MGACDGLRRLEPVAPAVGDRPSIGDEGRPRQSEWRGPICGDGGGHRTPSVTPVLGSILPDSLALPMLLLLFVLAGVGGTYQQAAARAVVQAMPDGQRGLASRGPGPRASRRGLIRMQPNDGPR